MDCTDAVVRILRSFDSHRTVIAQIAYAEGMRSHGTDVHADTLIHVSPDMEPHRACYGIFSALTRKASGQHIHAVKLSGTRNAIDFGNKLRNFDLNLHTVFRRIDTV